MVSSVHLSLSADHHQDLNARLTMNALPTLHASVKNVKIHAKATPVVSMPNVWLETTELSVFALMDLLVIRLPFVKNVRSIQKFVVLSPKSFDSSIVSVFLIFNTFAVFVEGFSLLSRSVTPLNYMKI